MTRVVLEFTGDASGESADWQAVEQVVDAAGGANLRMSHPELPGIATFDVPDDCELEPVLNRLREVRSVSRVEAEAWRTTVGEPGAPPPIPKDEEPC